MISPDEFTIEVRDVTLARQGQIDIVDITDLVIVKRFNNVGSWSLSLPFEHDMAAALAAPGAGLVVYGPTGLVCSGPMTIAQLVQDTNDADGTYFFTGVDDNVALADALIFPQPSNTNPNTQNVSHWEIGPTDAEDALRQAFTLNVGPGAQASRKPNTALHLTTDGNLGAVVTIKSRFDRLGELMAGIGKYANIRFDLRQDSTGIGLYIEAPTDRTGTIRMDIQNDLLDKVDRGIGAPTGTRYIVAGQGEGVDRQMVAVTDATAASAEASWGRKIEVFKDRRDTDDTVLLTQEGMEALETTGRTTTSLSVVPANDTTMVYLKDWFLGDLVTVVVQGQEIPTQVVESIIGINIDGVTTTATVGDPTGFDYEATMIQRQGQLEESLAFLQKNSEPVSGATIATMIEDAVSVARPFKNHCINGDGRVNQRVAVSGTSLASGAYFIDRWKSTAASNAVTWTGDAFVGRVITVPASKSIATIIERQDMPADTYYISHAGTAQVRAYNVGGSVPSYATGPIAVVIDGTANVTVEFGPGTVSKVQIETGAVTPFGFRPYAEELALCQRYYEKSYDPDVAPGTSTVVGMREHYGAADGSGNIVAFIPYKVQKRAAGTVTAYRQDGTVNSWAYQRNGGAGNAATTNNYRQSLGATCIYCNVGSAWAGGFVTGHWVVDAEL